VESRLLKLKELQHCSESVFISLRCMLHDQLIILRHPVSEGLLLKKSLYRKHMALDQTSRGVLFPSQTQRRAPLKIITYHRFGRTYCLNLQGKKSYLPTVKMQQRVAFWGTWHIFGSQHPSHYSSGLNPNYCRLFPELNSTLRDKDPRAQTTFSKNVTAALRTIPEEWQHRWTKSTAAQGSYFERNPLIKLW